MQNISLAYQEIGNLIKTIPAIKWVDLWYEQILKDNYLEHAHPAVFIEINVPKCNTIGENVQELEAKINIYVMSYLVANTHIGAESIITGVSFLDLLNDIHSVLQRATGTNFSPLNRSSIGQVSNNISGLISYSMTYDCIIMDYHGKNKYTEGIFTSPIEIKKGVSDVITPETPSFIVEL